MFQKKSLGQNFLRSKKALNDIITVSAIAPEDTVIEIGPGEGVLTKEIVLRKPKKIVCIEKDDRLIPVLNNQFKAEIQAGTMELVHADVIDLFTNSSFQTESPYKIIANIPYYITGLIIRHVFELKTLPVQVVLLVQKEVADRLVDTHKNNLLRASVTLYGDVKRVSVVPKGAFVPAPNVDSAIISITHIQKPETRELEDMFFTVVKKAFAHKRKKVLGNLQDVCSLDKTSWVTIFSNLGIPIDARPEDISTEQYIKISKQIILL